MAHADAHAINTYVNQRTRVDMTRSSPTTAEIQSPCCSLLLLGRYCTCLSHFTAFAGLTSSHVFCRHIRPPEPFAKDDWTDRTLVQTEFHHRKGGKMYVSSLSSCESEFENRTATSPRAATPSPSMASLIGNTWQKPWHIALSTSRTHYILPCPNAHPLKLLWEFWETIICYYLQFVKISQYAEYMLPKLCKAAVTLLPP